MGQITAGIASELDQQNYLMLLGNTELDEQREIGYLTAMQRNHVAGIILMGLDTPAIFAISLIVMGQVPLTRSASRRL